MGVSNGGVCKMDGRNPTEIVLGISPCQETSIYVSQKSNLFIRLIKPVLRTMGHRLIGVFLMDPRFQRQQQWFAKIVFKVKLAKFICEIK